MARLLLFSRTYSAFISGQMLNGMPIEICPLCIPVIPYLLSLCDSAIAPLSFVLTNDGFTYFPKCKRLMLLAEIKENEKNRPSGAVTSPD
jgi:hypothetical protein